MIRPTALRFLAPVVLLAACGSPTEPGADTITELPRALTTVEQAVIEHGNTFGLELVSRTVAGDERPNVILSPLSASMALGMTLNGAEGATFDGMRQALGFQGMSREEINEAYRGLIDLLTGLDPQVRFDIANSVWTNRSIPFHQAFLDAVRAAFDARAESRDFADPATLTAINAWVSQNTEGLIEKILDELDPQMAAILINAIYFDGAWTTRFDSGKTRSRAFRRADGSEVQVPMMSLTGAKAGLGGGSDFQAAELPYGGGAFSMVVVVPRPDLGAREFLETMDGAKWAEIVASLRETEVDEIALPRFTLAWDGYLNQPLKDMGMQLAFQPGADFSRMSPQGQGFCIDFVRQKTFIEVNERGTRAAAVTAVGARVVSFNGLIADRPFVFAIRERLSGTLLFLGMVGDPTLREADPPQLASDCR